MEFSGPAPLGPFAALAAELPWRKTSDVKHVEPGARAGDTTSDSGERPGQEVKAAAARDITTLRREMERRDLPAGPPPAFEVSLLEVAQDIKQVIARIEAARTQAREADALKADAGGRERDARVEAAAFDEAARAGTSPAEATGAPPVQAHDGAAGTDAADDAPTA